MRLPRASVLRLSLLALGLFVVGTNAFVIAGVLPQIAHTLGVGPGTVGYSISIYAVVVAVASPVVSVTCGRFAPERVMATGLVLIAAGTFLAAAATGFPMFTAGRVVAAFGGAALVPPALAAAPALVAPAQRGRAISIVGLGFTLAMAVGSPVGTALADIGGWRLPLSVLAGMAAVLAPTLLFVVRDVPRSVGVDLRSRAAVLGDRRVVFAIVASLLMTLAFNMVYIFSAVITHDATGGDPTRLAVLLLVYGLAGVVGNVVGGRLADRFGTRRTLEIVLAGQTVAFLALIPAHGSYLATALCFALSGVSGFAASVAVQVRLALIDPRFANVALAWYSTAMYLGISIAPLVGAAALPHGFPVLLAAASVSILVAVIASEVSHVRRRGYDEIARDQDLVCASATRS
ncbi:MFS transporter [Mycobacterium sp. AMU20-3851]|uniref:MFS transporter n=1 Tax=Mycobacterium sp. AMU20-3851 TaxID=3122055 RepID=UPI00375532B8